MSSEQRFFIVCLGDSEQYKSGSLVGVFSNMKIMFDSISSTFYNELMNAYVIGTRKNLDASYNAVVNIISRDGRCVIYRKEDNSILFKIQTIHMNTINPLFN
jgi:hypothetical protein